MSNSVTIAVENVIFFLSSFQGYGSVIQMYPGSGPVRAATDCFGFPKSFYTTLCEFPLNKLEALISGTGNYSGQIIPAEETTEKTDEESSKSDIEKQEATRDVLGDCLAEESMETGQPENEEGVKSSEEISENHKGGQNLDKKQLVSIGFHSITSTSVREDAAHQFSRLY